MKCFLCRIVKLFTPLIGVLLGLEYVVHQLPNSYSYKDVWMRNHADSVMVLVLGSSNMYAAFNPQLVVHSFNLANSFQRLEYDDYLLNRYASQYRNLKVVILGVDYVNIAFPNNSVGVYDRHRSISYKLYMEYPKQTYCSINNYEFSCNKPFVKKVCMFLQQIMGNEIELPCDSLGHAIYYNLNGKNDENMNERYGEKILRITDYSNSNLKYNYSHLLSIANFCKDSNVKLLLVSTPIWKTMRNQFVSDNVTKFKGMISDVMKHCPNIMYLDFTEDPRFTYNDFYDANHLSENGSWKFTKQIANIIDYNKLN